MAKSQEGRVEDIGRELGGRFKLTSLLQKQLREYVKGGRAFMPSVRNTHDLVSYILDLVAETRGGNRFLLGLSPRAGIGLYRAAQALAALAGRDYCVPDDVKRLAVSVFAHRVIPRPVHGGEPADGRRAIAAIIEKVPVPS